MDKSEPTVSPTVFAVLEDVADTLRDALRDAEQFNRKVRGAIPQDSATNTAQEPTLRRLVDEIAWLSRSIKTEIEMHHQMIGDSREKPLQASSVGTPLMKGRAAGY